MEQLQLDREQGIFQKWAGDRREKGVKGMLYQISYYWLQAHPTLCILISWCS